MFSACCCLHLTPCYRTGLATKIDGAGLVVDCPLGTYNPLENQDFATACLLCPLNSVTLETNSTERAACVCMEGFYDANASTAIDPELLRISTEEGEPMSMVAAVVECVECPVGTSCGQASTLEELPLLTGYYRLDTMTVDVRECPDARKNCSTNFGTTQCQSTSGCQGGKGNPCAPGLQGTYCERAPPRLERQRLFCVVIDRSWVRLAIGQCAIVLEVS